MHVNNETGVIQAIDSIAHALKEKDLFFHVDTGQSAGKLTIDLPQTPVDLLSISAHKLYGPKGIGCLYVRNRKKTGSRPWCGAVAKNTAYAPTPYPRIK